MSIFWCMWSISMKMELGARMEIKEEFMDPAYVTHFQLVGGIKLLT